MIRKVFLIILSLTILMKCGKNDKSSSSSRQENFTSVTDTIYLTNPKAGSNYKPLIISMSSNSSNLPVKFNSANKDTIKIKVLGISNYPIIIKEGKNVILDKINDSLFFMQVLDTMVYFEIWQDYGEGNVISKVQYSIDSISFIPYDGIRPVGRVTYP